MGIVEDLMEIWPNEVCDKEHGHYVSVQLNNDDNRVIVTVHHSISISIITIVVKSNTEQMVFFNV